MSIQNLSAEDLRQRLREQPDRLEIVDVRQPAEFAAVHIRGSKLIPLDQFESRWGEIDWARDVVFVCRSGARSRLTAQVAAAAGRDVGNLRFGIFECYRDGKGEFLEGSLGGVERYF
jgi:rhodanese-related sulfurtransferase